jgi:hypothetical protein
MEIAHVQPAQTVVTPLLVTQVERGQELAVSVGDTVKWDVQVTCHGIPHTMSI